MLSRTKIVTRLLAGFSLILLATLVLGMVAVHSSQRLTSLTENIFRHPFAVSMSIREAKTQVLVARQLMNILVQHGTPEEIERFRQKLLVQKEMADKNLAVVRERYLGSSQDVNRLERALAEWRGARSDTIDLVKQGRRAEAIAKNEGEDARLFDTLLEKMDVVSDFAADRAARFQQEAAEEGATSLTLISTLLLLGLGAGVVITFVVTRSVRKSLHHAASEVYRVIESTTAKAMVVESIGSGDLSQEIVASEPMKLDASKLPDDETGELLKAAALLSRVQYDLDESLRKMTESLRAGREAERSADWLKSGLNELNAVMRGERATADVADRALTFLAQYLKAGVGALYLADERGEVLTLAATYAYTRRKNLGDTFRLGEGLIGQAARERKTICLSNVPGDYLPIGSALGESVPKLVTALPLLQGSRLVGAMEIGSFHDFSDTELEFLGLACEALAVGLSVSLSRQRTAELLEETQQQAEELRMQQEELQQSNEELEQVSTYKSEFLANMSHELRTPLNSLMILSSLLAQNKDGNLSDKQVEFAATIHSAGTDLLNLINDILDLAKVEAGQMRFEADDLPVADLCASMRGLFQPQAEQRQLAFAVEADPAAPAMFHADGQRVQQILKNLLSNAIKFTSHGEVRLRIGVADARANPLGVPAIAFAVSDTGIGIPAAKRELVFQAFQQADGAINRKYGGTGLGLSISLTLARRMQGDIVVESGEGRGSTFTLYLPLAGASAAAPESRAPAREPAALAPPLPDLMSGMTEERKILVIEDDADFADILAAAIRERGFASLVANDGENGVALAERHLPSAIILDVMLPGMDGWDVMRRLKDNPRTRHIPVHFLSCLEERQKALAMAAIGFVTKPVGVEQLDEVFQAIETSIAKAVKRLLIVEDDHDEAYSMVALLDDKDVDISVAVTGQQAMELLATETFDCVVLDLGLSDMSGFELLDQVERSELGKRVPIIVHSGRSLTEDDERRLRRYAESIIIKGAKSPERLLNEVSLFLHQVESSLHPDKRRMIRAALDKEAMLEGRKVLLVDDDMRNLFSLSNVLGEKNMTVVEAENGAKALQRLRENPDVAVVLMDIMMPETDGYAAMREIRQDERFADLPVIAMTAKAMKGDYEKCMEAGASDYIAKPIDVEKLLSLLRVWIYQRA